MFSASSHSSRIPFAVALSLAAAASFIPTATAYDMGCQYVWKGPSDANDMMECLKKLPTDNPGVLIPPVIPLVFFVGLLIIFPIVFCGRCCGGCGSMKIRPGAGCCCDGDEWDEVPLEEKVKVYPSRHVFCIKIVCLIVTLLCIVSIVLMPLGSQMLISFTKDFFKSADTDVLLWADDLKNDLINDIKNDDGSFPSPLTADTFSPISEFISDARGSLKDADDMVSQYVNTVGNVISYVCFVPLALCAFLLLFILLSIRRILPPLFMWIYYIIGLIFSLLSVVMMIVGVMLILLDGEVELNTWKSPGILQWYGVPMCNDKAMFDTMKADFYAADKEKGVSLCREFMDICDDLLFGADVPMVSSTKPFHCDLTDANVETSCPSVAMAADLIDTIKAKTGAPICANECTVNECADSCTVQDTKDSAEQIRTGLAQGRRILKAIDRAFLYCDCDVLITQATKPLKDASKGATGAFLAAAGTGFGALFLMWAIVLMCKGQKLFFSSPSNSRRVGDYSANGKPNEYESMRPIE